MGKVIRFPRDRRAVDCLSRLSTEVTPETWPVEELGADGVTAAALMADRVDLLPEAVADPENAWASLPETMRAVVRERNPSMASFCAWCAREGP